MRIPHLALIGLLLLAACAKTPDATVGTNEEDWTEKIEVAMPRGGQVVDEQHGKEIWFAIGAMTNSGDEPANGVTQTHYFEDGEYLHNLKLNIARPEDGVFYEGWVVKRNDWVSLGHLKSHFADARHAVQFRDQQDLREHLEVKVTRELDDGNPLPGEVIAEGLLKVTLR